MKKVFGVLLILAGIVDFVTLIRVFFGYTPSQFDIISAFFVTSLTVIKWGIEYLEEAL